MYEHLINTDHISIIITFSEGGGVFGNYDVIIL